jgi:hypothetical protein
LTFYWCNTVSYTSFEKIRISGIPNREEQTIYKAATEGISPRWKMSFQNSGKLGPYESNNIQFTTV